MNVESFSSHAVRTLVEVCRRAAAGDLEARAPQGAGQGELDELANAINAMLDTADALCARPLRRWTAAAMMSFTDPYCCAV